MDKDIIIGCILIICSLGFISYIVFWSRRTIDFIARKKMTSLREIVKVLHERK